MEFYNSDTAQAQHMDIKRYWLFPGMQRHCAAHLLTLPAVALARVDDILYRHDWTAIMTKCCGFFASLLLALANVVVSRSKPPPPSSCGIYLAESTIPHAGLGMFAGKRYRQNEKVTDGDIVIPLLEVDWHNGHDGKHYACLG